MLNLSISVLAVSIPGFYCRKPDFFKNDLEVPGTEVGPSTEHLLNRLTGHRPAQENARRQATQPLPRVTAIVPYTGTAYKFNGAKSDRHVYYRAYVKLDIELDGNTFFSFVDIDAALSVQTMAFTGFVVNIQASHPQCDMPEIGILKGRNINTIRAAPFTRQDLDGVMVSNGNIKFSYRFMEQNQRALVGMRIPPPGTLGCVYTLKNWTASWGLNKKNEELGNYVLPALMGQMPVLVDETTLASYHDQFPREPAEEPELSNNNLGYALSYPNLNIQLNKNTLLTLVDFQSALEFATVAETGFSMNIQVSNPQCPDPELFLLTEDQDLRPMPTKWMVARYYASISREDMESFVKQKGRIGVRIPSPAIACVYTLKTLHTHWTLYEQSEQLGWNVLPAVMGQVPIFKIVEDSVQKKSLDAEQEYVKLSPAAFEFKTTGGAFRYYIGQGSYAPASIIAVNSKNEIIPLPQPTVRKVRTQVVYTYVWEEQEISYIIVQKAYNQKLTFDMQFNQT